MTIVSRLANRARDISVRILPRGGHEVPVDDEAVLAVPARDHIPRRSGVRVRGIVRAVIQVEKIERHRTGITRRRRRRRRRRLVPRFVETSLFPSRENATRMIDRQLTKIRTPPETHERDAE
jgi:hypothetical protein